MRVISISLQFQMYETKRNNICSVMQSDVSIVSWIKQQVIRDSVFLHTSQEKQRGYVERIYIRV